MAALKPVDRKFISVIDDAVVTGTSGYLMCRRDLTYWCIHVEKILKEGADAPYIFSDLREMLGSAHIGVPIIPTRNIFAEIWAEEWREGSVKTWLNSPGDAVQNQMFSDRGIFLGFLDAGEGRSILRQLVLEEFASDFVPNEPQGKCGALGHNIFTQRIIERECQTDLGARLANGWCMRFYNKCYSCFRVEGPNRNFDPDLIPEM